MFVPVNPTLTAALVVPLLLVAAVAATEAEPERDRYVVPDTEALLRLLALERPERAAVRAALARGDTAAAAQAYIAEFRRKPISSPLLTDWRLTARDAQRSTARADAFLAGHLHDGYSTYEVPPTGLNWRESPLSCVTRFPLLGPVRNAYHHTREPRYARWLVDHMLGFVRAWPMAEYLGHTSREGWTSHTTVAKPWYWCMVPERLNEMAETINLLRDSPEVTDGELTELLRRLLEEAGYCRQEIRLWVVELKHNGGCAMIGSLAMACAILDDFQPAKAILSHDADMAAAYLQQAFYPDGMCIEQTVAYSQSCSAMTQEFCYALRDTPSMGTERDAVAALVMCLVGLSEPTGGLPSFGDLYAGDLAGSICRPALAWLELPWVEALLAAKAAPPPPFLHWPTPDQPQWCGYYAMRSDWTRTGRYLCIDAGPWGTTHQHGDRLSIVVDAYGARFIIDPSSTRYAANEPDAFISRQVASFLHNTLTVDGVDEFREGNGVLQAKKPLQNRWEQGPTHCLFAGSYSFAPLKPVTWERRIVFAGGQYWLLQDLLTGELPAVQIEQNFQFEADVRVEFIGTRTLATAPNGAKLMLVPLSGSLVPTLSLGVREPHVTYWPDGKAKTVQCKEDGVEQKHGRGWTGRSGHRLLPAPAVTYTGPATLPGEITLALVPLRPDQDPDEIPEIGHQVAAGLTTWALPHGSGTLRVQTASDCFRVLEDTGVRHSGPWRTGSAGANRSARPWPRAAKTAKGRFHWPGLDTLHAVVAFAGGRRDSVPRVALGEQSDSVT